MFQKHVIDRLAAYVDDELPSSEAQRMATHLATCSRCHDALDRARFAARMMDELPLVEAPLAIWASIETELARHPRTVMALAPWRVGTFDVSSLRRLAVAAILVVAAVVYWQRTASLDPWEIARLDAWTNSKVEIGEWIETDDRSRARIRIGEIGIVDIEPNTRISVLTARRGEHRLNLARGRISAEIVAPPRFFFVETPSSTVVDLGCAYTMEVDEAGNGLLRVTSGWASLEWDKLESLVPAGASASTRDDLGPGTPAFDDASAKLREALSAFDYRNGGSAALDIVLVESRTRDTLTLWHLMSRASDADRPRVFDRIVQLVPLPAGVTRERALALDGATLKLWREELAWSW